MADVLSSSELLAKAQRLEGKKLYVKAAEIYAQLKMPDQAAAAFELGGAFEQAAALFDTLGKNADAARCRKAAEAEKNPQTWAELQSDFVADYPG